MKMYSSLLLLLFVFPFSAPEMATMDGISTSTNLTSEETTCEPDTIPQVLRIYGSNASGDNIYLNEHLRFAPQSTLTGDDVWQFVPVENGHFVMRCPSRGYLVAGMAQNNVIFLGYHQFEKTATRFKAESGHLGNGQGYVSYRFVSSNPHHKDYFLGSWNHKLVLRKGTGDATSFLAE